MRVLIRYRVILFGHDAALASIPSLQFCRRENHRGQNFPADKTK